MPLLDSYLNKQQSTSLTDSFPVSAKTQLIVVIPAYNEPDLCKTLASLAACETGDFRTEVIVLINSYLHTSQEIKAVNMYTYQEVRQFALENNTAYLKIMPVLIENLQGKQTGAGIPRKIGMDEAVRRFNKTGNEKGIIVSLDADCTVEKNYLSELYHFFNTDAKLCSATIRFHHPVAHFSEEDPIRKASVIYETYLRYYKQALEYCGFPYAYFTIGSAFAVKVSAYVQSGGMGKQEAGEDFYFLHKIFPLGKTTEINTTTVYPAARLSDRVPFGTGPALRKMTEEKEIVKYTYSLESFKILKSFFQDTALLYKAPSKEIRERIKKYPQPLQDFLESDNFSEQITVINANTASLPAFVKRFFHYFNAFKVLKYLNYIHPTYIKLKEVSEEYKKLLELIPETDTY